MRSSGKIDVRPRHLLIDGAPITEQWIEPDPWSWCYRAPRRPV